MVLGCRSKVVPTRAAEGTDHSDACTTCGASDDAVGASDGGDAAPDDAASPPADTAGHDSGGSAPDAQGLTDAAPTPHDAAWGPADTEGPTDASTDASSKDVSDGGSCVASPGPRRLRLLTRREYDHTVRDLLGAGASTANSCGSDLDCDVLTASCVAGVCTSDPCSLVTFAFDPQGKSYTTVHVAGDFNGWPPSPTDGLALTYVPAKALWVGKRAFANGTYLYKYVLDGSTWVHDPKSAAVQPDGFGGSNTVLSVSCGAEDAAAITSLAAAFPPETRPDAFAYDDHTESGVVTSVHVEQALAAAKALASGLTLAPLLAGCTAQTEACAAQFVTAFGLRAFRRPLTAAEVARYVARVLAAPSLDEGARRAVRVFLSSPYFFYRFELGQPSDGAYALDAWELASALSYFLTGSMPDAPLFDAAASGALLQPETLRAEAERLLDTPAARRHLSAFALQWLGLERLYNADKSALFFPTWSDALRDAMLEETRRFFEYVVFDEAGGLDQLFTSSTTFVNDLLGGLYGVSGGASFALTASPADRAGAGLLGHASLLTATSHSDQTSPIRRGLLVRRALLCQELGSPPPNAGGVPEVDPNATTRERFKQHTNDSFCQGCHQFIDDVGFGFERFDAIGAYRTTENGAPIPPDGDLNDVDGLGSGTHAPYTTLAQLGSALVHSKTLPACFVKQLVRFQSGRLEGGSDQCDLQQLTAAFAPTGDAAGSVPIRELLLDLVTRPAFRVRGP